MKTIILVLLSSMLLMACGNSEKRQTDYNEVIPVSKTEYERNEDTVLTEKKASETPPAAKSASSQSSGTSHDNMRGFDPASEDDMDDNGMSRYFENNDDEGWD